MSLNQAISQSLELNITDEMAPGATVRVYPSPKGGYDVEVQYPTSCVFTVDQMFARISARMNVLNFAANLNMTHSYLPWFTMTLRLGA